MNTPIPSRGRRSSPLEGILLALILLLFLVLAWSPKADRFTWFLENAPLLVGIPVLIATHRRLPLTGLLYVLIALHAVVLMVGGYYTYAEVPAGFWVKAQLGLSRNPYDRLGHLFQGFVPVLILREVLFRKGILKPGGWAVLLLLLSTLGISAAYELAEWLAAVLTGAKADAFLGAQGDVWDSQWDMACAVSGAALSLLTLSRLHDRQLARMEESGQDH